MNSTTFLTVRDLYALLRERSKAVVLFELKQKVKNSKILQAAASSTVFIYTVIKTLLKISLKTICFAIAYVLRHPIQIAINFVFAVSIAIMAITGSDINKQVILSEISEETLMNIIEASKFNRGFNNEDMKQSGVRELTRVGAPAWIQKEGIKAILYHARKASLSIEDQAVLLAIANIESGFNPLAQANITTACGLFQFVQKTGETFSLKSTECMDPWKNAAAEVNHYSSNYNARVKPFVEDLNGTEKTFRTFELSYYLHHDGPSSSNPSNDVKAIVLDGTQFLFSAYHTLQKETENEKSAPTFSELFTNRMWTYLTSLTERFSPKYIPSVALITDSQETVNKNG